MSGRGKLVGLALAVALAAPAAAAAPGRFVVRHFGLEDGLPQSSARTLAHTPDGFLWVGTEEGLARFDGRHFRVFDTTNTPELGHDMIERLAVGSDGTLWIATTAGVARLRDGVFSGVASTAGLGVTAFAELAPGRLAVGTRSGLFVLGPEDDLEPWPGFSAGVFDLARAANGDLLLATPDGLFRASPGAVPQAVPGFSGVTGRLLVEGDGFLVVSEGEVRNASGESLPVPEAHRDAGVEALVRGADGTLWVGSYGRGLGRLGPSGPLEGAPELAYGAVADLLAMPDGSLFAGTDGGGLFQIFAGRFAVFGQSEGLPGDEIHAVLADRRGRLWVGTDEGGVGVLEGDRVVARIGVAEGLPSETVTALLEAPDGAIWIGTDRGLVRHFDRGSRPLSIVAADGVEVLGLGPHDGIFAATPEGLFRATLSGLEPVPESWRVGATHPVRFLHRDRAGRLWVGTLGDGARRIEPDGRVSLFLPTEGHPALLAAAVEPAPGELWFGTDRGLCRFAGERFACFGRRGGLPSELVFGLADDGRGQLWFATNRGLGTVPWQDARAVALGQLERLEPRVFGLDDGLRSVEANGGSPQNAQTPDGRLWFAMLDGLAGLDLEPPEPVRPPPRAVFEEIRTSRERLDPRVPAVLGPGLAGLEIHYAAAAFAAPGGLRFRHRLVGLDDTWSPPTEDHAVHFGRLAPGSYRFEVAASQDGGLHFAAEPARFHFEVRPHLWETRGFGAVVLVLVAALGAALMRWRNRWRLLRARERERELLAQVETRTSELRRANLELERLSREDPLTGLANRRVFAETLDAELRRTVRTRQPLSLLLLDVDHFKAYNDHLGHPAGDRCLRVVAELLAATVGRAGDLVARYGGEEFAAVLAGTDREGARAVAEEVRTRLAAASLPHPASPLGRVTASFGIATTTADSPTGPDELLARADAALYRAKQDGRDRIVEAAGR